MYTDSRKLMLVKEVLELTDDNTLSQVENIIRSSKKSDAAVSVKRKKSTVLAGIKQGLEEVKLYKKGKIKLKTAQQLLDEL